MKKTNSTIKSNRVVKDNCAVKDNCIIRGNKKINDAKKIIREEKKKIKIEKKNIRNKKIEKFKKTKTGKVCSKMFFFLDDKKENYSFSELFGVTVVSLVLGFFVCICVMTIMTGGRNYFRISKQFLKFYDVYDVILNNYYGKVDENKLIDAAIDGMVSSVDDVYTSYNNASATDRFNEMVNGTYEGIGCTIAASDDGIMVMEVYDDTPADKAGLKSNDIITEIDGKDTKDMDIEELSSYVKTEAKGKIKMSILRDKVFEVTLERDKVEIPAIHTEIYEKNGKKIGYMNISIFSSVSAKQFKEKLAELEKKKIDGLVIDVRNNSGGYLTSVQDIASYLLPRGKVIYQVQTEKKKNATKDKTGDKRKYPIAVVANSGSASASEILAAAIKESYGGFVVGTKTFGKGTVQQVKKLSDGSMVKYTTQNWLTPNGDWINEKGIEPTDMVELDEEYYNNPIASNDNQLQKALELVSK